MTRLVVAQETTYSPDYCEFSITFPGEPYHVRRCEKDNPGSCYNLVSYTQVYELSTTVNFRVICNPASEDIYAHYDENVMKATLRAMTKKSVVDEYQTSFREEERYKQAGLVGEGQAGKWQTLFIAQLWVGKASIFSVEAELIGEPFEAPDKLFADILKSVLYKKSTPDVIPTDPAKP